MEVTREGVVSRWAVMVATWAMVAWLATSHVTAMRNYVTLLDSARVTTRPATPHERPLPGSFADAQTWVRYAEARRTADSWRIRHTDTDNAPHGRPVHWSSLFVNLVSAAGGYEQGRSGGSYARALEASLAWFNLPLLLTAVVAFSGWCAARAGAGAGVLLAAAMIGHRPFYDAFTPNYVDHHGLLNASALGVVLGAVFMGAGWWRSGERERGLLPATLGSARGAAVVSALCGAFGLWISAATLIPVIALVGLGALAITALLARRTVSEGARFEPRLWRLWGRVGAIASLVFYLIEYAPSHLGWRLEVNHPLYAAAWWGGSELIAHVGEWIVDRRTRRLPMRPLLLPALAIGAAPFTMIIGGTAVFLVRDPFVADLRHTVGEGMSFRAAARAFGSTYAQGYVVYFVLLVVSAGATLIAKRDRMLLGFATLLLSAMTLMACAEIRWWLAASSAFLAVTLLLVAQLSRRQRGPVRWAITLAVAALLVPSGAVSGARTLRQQVTNRSADPGDLLQTVYRDVAAAIVESQPAKPVVLLASPDASAGIGYYGNFRTIGTLYWENVDGLKAAAAMFSAKQDEEARSLLTSRGVTHVAVVSRGNFLQEYLRLLEPQGASNAFEQTFGYRLAVRRQVPRWLRLMPYRLPPSVAVPELRVLLFEVVGEQSEFDGQWNIATAMLTLGDVNAAAQAFDTAIKSVAVTERPALIIKASERAQQVRADALTIALFRGLLQLQPEPGIAVELVWLLATSPQDNARNGREALGLIEPLLQAHPEEPRVLNAAAAALAENGRFDDAATVAARAVTIIRAQGEESTAKLLEQRVDAYRNSRPWRQ